MLKKAYNKIMATVLVLIMVMILLPVIPVMAADLEKTINQGETLTMTASEAFGCEITDSTSYVGGFTQPKTVENVTADILFLEAPELWPLEYGETIDVFINDSAYWLSDDEVEFQYSSPGVYEFTARLFEYDGILNPMLIQQTIQITVSPSTIAPPTLTADTTNNSVDNDIEITFASDAGFQSAITSVTYGGNTLTSNQYTVTSGKVTLRPSVNDNNYLRTPGTGNVVITATGYGNSTISQTINAGEVASIEVTKQPVTGTASGDTFSTQPVVKLKDQYGNYCATGVSATANVVASSKSGTGSWSIGGATTRAAVAGTATFTDLTCTLNTVGNGSITFTSGIKTVDSSVFTIPKNTTKEITAFIFNGLTPAATGTVNEGAKTIALTVPYGTNVTALVPTITHNGASVSPNTGVDQNFTNPVTYTVTAEDNSTQQYIVTVTIAANPAKAITAFNFNGLTPNVIGTVNEGAKTIALTVPYGTNVTALVPNITHTGASVSPNTGVAQNFTNPVTYTVTAADSSTQQYTVTIAYVVNHAPTLSTTASMPTYTEGGSAVSLFSGTSVTIGSGDTGQTLKQLTLTVSNVSDGSHEILTIDGTEVILTNGNAVTTSTNGVNCLVSVAGSTATVTLTKTGDFSETGMQDLVDGLQYRNMSQEPTSNTRVVTLTSLKDSGGTINGGVDTTVLNVASTVCVITVPGSPTAVTAIGGDGQATVSFIAPSSNGGSAISGYTVTSSPGGFTASGASSPLTVTGLTNGTSYTFTVTATNGIGTGAASATSTAVIPETKAVTSLEVLTQPTKLSYTEGESLDLTGMVVTLTYNDTSTEDVGLADFVTKGVTTSLANATVMSVATHNGQVVTVSCNGHSASTNSLTVSNLPTYTITQITDQTMTPKNEGYAGTQETKTITISKSGTGNLSNLQVSLNKGNSSDFTITQPQATTLDGTTPFTTFTIKAKDGLTAGTYTDTVTIMADNMTNVTFNVEQVINPIILPTVTAPTLQSAIAGDGGIRIEWNTVTADNYKIYKATQSGVYGSAYEIVTGSENSLDITGLNNGTTYYFTVTAVVDGTESNKSNEMSATPQAIVVGAPQLRLESVGNGYAAIAWNEVIGSTGYSIYHGTTSNNYTLLNTVAGSVYDCSVTGLSNGTTYYFAIKAINSGGHSPYSNEVVATPKTRPAAPTNVVAVAGNRQATVTFTPPADNGGSPITGYRVTANPGNITVNTTGTTAIVTGLNNGTAYTFTVKAINEVDSSVASAVSNMVTPVAPVIPVTPPSNDSDSNDSSGSGGGSTSTPITPSTPTETGVEILVNGKVETAATATITTQAGKTVVAVTVDDKKIEEKLEREGNNSVVTIPVKADADVVIGQLSGQTVKNMEQKAAVLEIKTGNVTYTLPAAQINIGAVSGQIGRAIELKDIMVNVSIAQTPTQTAKVVEDTANRNNYQVVVRPVDFEITCISGDKTVSISKFNGYVERMVAIPDGIDPSKITTGIVLNSDGTFSHVPTQVIKMADKFYAKINSLTNSTYSVIYSPRVFSDVESHWAKDAVNDMGSRLIVSGIEKESFEPDRDITRAEFAAIIVRGLGLMRPNVGKDIFKDVTREAWYYDAVTIAYENGIISGYGEGKFAPMDKITREQAMVMVARAMKITDLKVEFKADEVENLLSSFTDGDKASTWAKVAIAQCSMAQIVTGRGANEIAPTENITRAEVAVIVRKLLQKSKLI